MYVDWSAVREEGLLARRRGIYSSGLRFKV